ncbi:MAG: hypothetical protein SAJ37_16345, partial [Oscillatoria sp. PMC 1068.18]|nr:hypothetical protein [Oscillatoria sp. PMC 1068.18]
VLKLLLPEMKDNLLKNLSNCFTACKTPARITHLGMMLSRQTEGLRINITKIYPQQIVSYLERVGYPSDLEPIELLVIKLLKSVDYFRLCLNVGDTIDAKVGLECFMNPKPKLSLRWSEFLDNLVNEGLCSAEKQQALLNWIGNTTPQTSSQPWLSDLIAESCLKPPNQFSSFARIISHLKFVYSPPNLLETKAYFGFYHQWLQPNFTQK